MSALNPYDNEDLYAGIRLGGPGGLVSPGKVTLSGHDSKVKWDIKSGNGQAGATTTKKGADPVEFTASFYLVKDPGQGIDDFTDWEAFAALIESTVSGAKPKALDVYHPDLAKNGIKSVVKSSIGGVTHDGKGGQTIVVKFLEYRPPKAAGGSPSGSSTTSSAKGAERAANDPNAKAEAEIAQLTNQYQVTPWG